MCCWQLLDVGETEQGVSTLSITVPKSEASGFINNKKELYNFQYGIMWRGLLACCLKRVTCMLRKEVIAIVTL